MLRDGGLEFGFCNFTRSVPRKLENRGGTSFFPNSTGSECEWRRVDEEDCSTTAMDRRVFSVSQASKGIDLLFVNLPVLPVRSRYSSAC